MSRRQRPVRPLPRACAVSPRLRRGASARKRRDGLRSPRQIAPPAQAARHSPRLSSTRSEKTPARPRRAAPSPPRTCRSGNALPLPSPPDTMPTGNAFRSAKKATRSATASACSLPANAPPHKRGRERTAPDTGRGRFAPRPRRLSALAVSCSRRALTFKILSRENFSTSG